MPRPKRPERVHRDEWFPDAVRPNLTLLDIHDYRALIGSRADRLIDRYFAGWHRADHRGRRPEVRRNTLINHLAKLFHKRSGMELTLKPDNVSARQYEREYRDRLVRFLVIVLLANNIPFPKRLITHLHYVEDRYCKPRR